MLPPAFWHTSALLPLCATQRNTPVAIRYRGQYNVVAWWALRVELASGLGRLRRMRYLDAVAYTFAKELAADVLSSAFIIPPVQRIGEDATELVERHELRAGDALQLAAALHWCDHHPRQQVFLTGDQRLASAAAVVGFAVPRL